MYDALWTLPFTSLEVEDQVNMDLIIFLNLFMNQRDIFILHYCQE